jgi:hypothetical protein
LAGDINLDRGSEEDCLLVVVVGGDVSEESLDDLSMKDQESGTTMKTWSCGSCGGWTMIW